MPEWYAHIPHIRTDMSSSISEEVWRSKTQKIYTIFGVLKHFMLASRENSEKHAQGAFLLQAGLSCYFLLWHVVHP